WRLEAPPEGVKCFDASRRQEMVDGQCHDEDARGCDGWQARLTDGVSLVDMDGIEVAGCSAVAGYLHPGDRPQVIGCAGGGPVPEVDRRRLAWTGHLDEGRALGLNDPA